MEAGEFTLPPFTMEDITYEQAIELMKLGHSQTMDMMDKLIELKRLQRINPDEEVTSIDDVIRAVTPDGGELPGR
jgi:hypothetical protein